jgi:hypothetical protein
MRHAVKLKFLATRARKTKAQMCNLPYNIFASIIVKTKSSDNNCSNIQFDITTSTPKIDEYLWNIIIIKPAFKVLSIQAGVEAAAFYLSKWSWRPATSCDDFIE